MFSVSLFFAVLLFGAACAQAQEIDASAYCFQCTQRRNHKDAYPDPAGDCHSFYKCQYVNDTYAIGTKLSCPVGTYWHDEVLACLPEGPVPCSDNCQTPSVQAKGCYALTANCASYFVCSGTASYAFCCPPKTSFNSETCRCDTSETCTDICTIVTPTPTTEAPPQNFDTFCIDSYNNKIQPAADPAFFQIVGHEQIHTLGCAPGTTFNLTTCRCEGEVVPETNPVNRQCVLYLPFDSDTSDNSKSDFWTDLILPAGVDNTVYAQGSGSLAVSAGGHLEVPGTKSLDFGHTVGICLYYRCNPDLQASCAGGLFSNNKDAAASEFNSITAALGLNQVLFIGESLTGVASDPVTFDPATNAPSGFTQVCGSFNGTHGALYVNNIQVALFASNPEFAFAHCPVAIGTDQTYGDYNGWIDEVLVCPFGITASDVDAHWNGPPALAAAGLVPA